MWRMSVFVWRNFRQKILIFEVVMKGVYIFLAEGFEDVEALGTYDVLKRGGVKVELVGISDDPFVTSSHGITVGVDLNLTDLICNHAGTSAEDFLIFPGGMPGSRNLASCTELMEMMRGHFENGGSLAAICAAPGLVLGQLDCWEGKRFSCFDGFESYITEKGGEFDPRPAVVVDCPEGNYLVTGRSAGHAPTFALEILKLIKGEEEAEKVKYALYL